MQGAAVHVLLEILRDWRYGHTTCCACSVHIKMAVTVDELAEEAGLSLQCLEKAFHVEHIRVMFCLSFVISGRILGIT